MQTGIFHHLKRHYYLAAPALAVMLAAPASAAVLVNDTFADNERSTQSLPDSVQWFGPSDGALDASSGALVLATIAKSGAIGFFTPAESPLTLGVGESLKLSFNITTPAADGLAGDNSFLYGLLDSGGTRTVNDTTGFNSGVYGLDVGYFAVSPLAGAHPARNKIVQRTPVLPGGTNNLTSSGAFTQIGDGAATPNLDAGGTYLYSLLLVRDSASQITLTSNQGGVEVVRVDDADLVTTFDTIFIYTGENPTTTVDNITLEYNAVPEPASAGLLAAGLVGLLGRRNRQRAQGQRGSPRGCRTRCHRSRCAATCAHQDDSCAGPMSRSGLGQPRSGLRLIGRIAGASLQ